jgi:hypothetical protein
MKKFLPFLAIALISTLAVMTVAAQKQLSKEDLLKAISKVINSKKPEDLDKAYQYSTEYLQRFGDDTGENLPKIKNFVKQYREHKVYVDLNEKNYADAFAVGKQLLAEYPDDVAITFNLAYGGYGALTKKNDASFANDSSAYAKTSIDLLGKGTMPDKFDPFLNKDDANSWMYYIIAAFQQESNLKDAAVNYYKAVQFDSPIKKSAQPYYVIAVYYEDVYNKMSTILQAKSSTLPKAELDAETAKVNTVIDLMLDAYARAYTYGVAEKTPNTEVWKSRMLEVYKFRKNTDAGFDAFVAAAAASPMKELQ